MAWRTISPAIRAFDSARLGLFGILWCGGYALKAAQTDKRFKAIATLSMFNSGRVRRNGYNDSQLATIHGTTAAGLRRPRQEASRRGGALLRRCQSN